MLFRLAFRVAPGVFLSLSCLLLLQVAESMEVIPGKSVGEVKLGMSKESVRSLLGEPIDLGETSWTYKLEDSQSVLVVNFSQTVDVLTFIGTAFQTKDEVSTANAFSVATEKKFPRWLNGDSGESAVIFPGGGLMFHSVTRGDTQVIAGVVYSASEDIAKSLNESGYAEVTGKQDPQLPQMDSSSKQDPVFKPGESTKPVNGMLVVKGLFLGMRMYDALKIMDEAMAFSYSQEIDQRSDGGEDVYFTIRAEIGEGSIAAVLIEVNKYGTLDVTPVLFPNIGERLNELVGSTNTPKEQRAMVAATEQAIKKVIEELNSGLVLCPWLFDERRNKQTVITLDLGTILVANADQEVVEIGLGTGLVDLWFNASDMSAQAFIQQFINSYSIPEMSPESSYNQFSESIDTSWHHTSPAGFKLTIYENKAISIERVASAAERRFD